MDLSSISTGLVSANVSGSIDVGVLKAVQNLDQNQAAMLAASIGLGANVDSFA